MAKDQQGAGGGTATHAGTNYQNRVAAWSGVHILAEQAAVPPWDLPASITLESLHAETPHAVDDLAVQTSAGGSSLSQAKHTLSLHTTADSPFGSAISQFVREYRAANPPLDAAKDRLVIATTSLSSAPIKTHLPAFLNRIRSSSAPEQEWTAGNAEENQAAATLHEHIKRAWRDETAVDPDPADVIAILRLSHIQILDVDEGGQSEREAKLLLRSSILADPTAADAAWNTLITATAGYAVNAQRADRAALQRALTDAGFAIKAQHSFQADIERLKDHTTATLRGLIDYSRIQVGSQNVIIRRGAAADLRAASYDGHLLVLGVPGAGKSGALYELVHELDSQGTDVVLFAVDQIEAGSTGALRTELNLTHELLTVLAAWPGTKPGYLVIDALDAARSDGAIKTLQTIIGEVIASNSRWHVVASVRKFDLRYNPNLQRLFHGTPASEKYKDGEFFAIRHVNIPVLADDELAQIQSQSPPLGALVSEANALLQEILHLPFNLRLLAELLDAGISAAELQPVRTQVELLDRYWRKRIIRHDGDGDARELVLRRVTSEMVIRRALRVARTAAIADDASSGAFLDDLLSTHVLAEWTTQTGAARREFLTFPHHLLFDYAAARLYVPVEAAELVDLLAKEPDLLIAIRPSIELHFQRLWHHDQASFWDLTFRSLEAQINEVGKLLGPSVAALHATALSQTQPLLDCLNDPARRAIGIAGLQHILATLLTFGTTTGSIRPGPWIEFLDTAIANLTPQLAGTARPYLNFLSENAATLQDAERNRVGALARRLLSFAVTGTSPNWLLAVNCINAVTKTIATDPAGSIAILRLCITDDHLKNYGYRTFSALARQVPVLVSIDSGFVRDLYVAGFAHSDQSDEKTMMGDGQILPMSSNRKQDYDLGLWSLAEHYPKYLVAAPRAALDALLKIADQYVRGRRKATDDAVPVMLDDQQTGMVRDNSSIWGNGVSHHDDPVRMLQAFQNYLECQADNALIQQLVWDISAQSPPAVVWRILLSCGIKHPATIGYVIRSLAWDHYVLTERDTTSLAGQFLPAIYPLLSEGERARVEQAIMAIPVIAPQNLKAANRARDRLVGCIDRTLLATAEALSHRATLDAAGGPPGNIQEPRFEFSHREFTHEDYLRDKGVPLEDPEHARLLAIIRPVSNFAHEFLNGIPTLERISAILPNMRALDAETDAIQEIHAEVRNQGLTDLLRSCGVILRSDEFPWDEETLAFIRKIVMRELSAAEPPPDAEHEEDLETISFNSARGEAALVLMLLAHRGVDLAKDPQPTITRLAGDPVATVRFQIAHHLHYLYKTATDLMWRLLEQFSIQEQNTEVLQGTLDVLQRCAGVDAPRTAQLAVKVFDRAPAEGPRVTEMRDQCSNIFICLTVWHQETASTDVIESMMASPLQYSHDLRHVVFDLSRWFQDDNEETRVRAFTLLDRILDAQIAAMRTLEAKFTSQAFYTWPETEQKQYSEFVRTADEVAMRLHLNSGASSANQASPLTPDPEFYRLAKPLLKKLAAMWHPHTAHSVIETLVYFAPLDPADVLLMIGEVVKASSAQGYQYEQLGEDLIVRMVERYLAQYRPILREHRECHAALMEILDVFVRVGWPRAHQLTYRLSEIYR